jgi:hypothetical protein
VDFGEAPTQTALRFALVTPARFRRLNGEDAVWNAPCIGTLEWPGEAEVDALVWVRDALLAPRAGSSLTAWSWLRRGYEGVQWVHPNSLGAVFATERALMLAEPAAAPAAPPPGVSADWQQTFAEVLRAVRAAPPDEDLLLISR